MNISHFLTQGGDVPRRLHDTLPTIMVLVQLVPKLFKHRCEGVSCNGPRWSGFLEFVMTFFYLPFAIPLKSGHGLSRYLVFYSDNELFLFLLLLLLSCWWLIAWVLGLVALAFPALNPGCNWLGASAPSFTPNAPTPGVCGY